MQFRIASFNVENLFDRAKALNTTNWAEGAPVLAAHAELNKLFQRDSYTAAAKKKMVELLATLGLEKSDSAGYARLRVIRGKLLARPKNKPPEIVADGRSDWIGWVELVDEEVNEQATANTARVMKDVDADILGVVEAESRPVLEMFSGAMLEQVGGAPYDEVMLIDGNDGRGIDVGILLRKPWTIDHIVTHVFDADAEGVVFSRDCCEYHLVNGQHRVAVVTNHLKSKGYSTAGDPTGAKRRLRQATRVAEIYRDLVKAGHDFVAITGDFNDGPNSAALDPLLNGTNLKDISTHDQFDPGPREGTFGSGGIGDKIDYILLSPKLFTKATGGGIFRKGVWRGERTRDKWDIYATLTKPAEAASDHAAIYADFEL